MLVKIGKLISLYFIIIIVINKNAKKTLYKYRRASMSQYFDNLIWDTFL